MRYRNDLKLKAQTLTLGFGDKEFTVDDVSQLLTELSLPDRYRFAWGAVRKLRHEGKIVLVGARVTRTKANTYINANCVLRNSHDHEY